MTIAAVPYGPFLLDQIKQIDPVDFDANTFAVQLHTASYAPNRDTDHYATDLTNEVAGGGGYATGGIELTGIAVGWDSTGHFVYIDWDDPLWTTATLSARYIVLKKKTGTAGTEKLIAFADFGSTQSPAGINFGVTFPATSAGGAVKIGG